VHACEWDWWSYENMTSSTKLEVDKILHAVRREPSYDYAGNKHHNVVKFARVACEICSLTRRHANRQKDAIVAILHNINDDASLLNVKTGLFVVFVIHRDEE